MTTARPRAALWLALVQFLFVSTWTLYVLYLPKLLAAHGAPPEWAPRILLLDQLVFMVADIATGLYTDRLQRLVGRLGPAIVGATALSCLAFLLLPQAAAWGVGSPMLALVLTLVWTTTSSALRAPPWVLLGRHAARPALPWLNALTLLGLAAGGACAPFLGVLLAGVDPRLPFALASLTLLATTAGLVVAERQLARERASDGLTATPAAPAPPPSVLAPTAHARWMLAVLLLALGFQTHFSLNTAPQFLRFANPTQLPWLMPLFWVGFGLAMVPAGALYRRVGTARLMATSALVGAVAATTAALAPSLDALIATQLVCGAAWGITVVGIFTSASERGRIGREGLALGTMFTMLALATLLRIAAVLAALPRDPALAAWLPWLPVALWAGGGLMAFGKRNDRLSSP